MPDPLSPGGAAGSLRRALFVLGGANAVIVATEFIVIGLLPVLARDLGTSLAEAGLLVTAFAASAALLGPPLTVAALALPIRGTLTAILILFAASNLAAVLIADYRLLLLIRIVQGAALPAFLSLGAATVLALAAPGARGRALALANIGFVIGLIVAMPAGVALAAWGLWAPSIALLAALSLAAAILVHAGLPITRPEREARSSQWRLLAEAAFLHHLLLSVAIFSATFCAYVYLAAWLESAGFGTVSIALLLAYFGVAGLIGNQLAAKYADRIPLAATLVALAAVPLAAIAAMQVTSLLPVLLLLGLWGAAHTACVALCQVRVTLAGGDRSAFAMALNISSANLGIALGALAGGALIEAWGLHSIGWGAGAIGLVAAALAHNVRMPGSGRPANGDRAPARNGARPARQRGRRG